MRYTCISLGLLSAMATLPSCETCYSCGTEDCIESAGVFICASNYDSSGGATWESTKATYIEAGWTDVEEVATEVCDEAGKTDAEAEGLVCTAS